jgi:hypothetical protein
MELSRPVSISHDLIQRTLVAFIYSPAASANNCSRKADRCILVADIGHSSTNRTTLGTLNEAIWPSQYSTISFAATLAPGFN